MIEITQVTLLRIDLVKHNTISLNLDGRFLFRHMMKFDSSCFCLSQAYHECGVPPIFVLGAMRDLVELLMVCN